MAISEGRDGQVVYQIVATAEAEVIRGDQTKTDEDNEE